MRMSKITINEVVDLVNDPESKMIVRRILNQLQGEETLNVLVSDLTAALEKTADNDLIFSLLNLVCQARGALKKEKGHASVW